MQSALAKSLCDDVQFSPEDATRTDRDFLIEVLNAVVDAGATTAEHSGHGRLHAAGRIRRTDKMIRQRVRGIENVTISAHCHNDLGLAVANTLAAICTRGATGRVHDQRNWRARGQCFAGRNCDGDEGARRPYPFDTGIVSEQLYPASQLLSDITGVSVQPNKAIIGRNAFAHEAGIHQDGMLKNPLTYEIMTPQSVGVPDSRLVLGKHSGTARVGDPLRATGIRIRAARTGRGLSEICSCRRSNQNSAGQRSAGADSRTA